MEENSVSKPNDDKITQLEAQLQEANKQVLTQSDA
jgi:hypothetical protein